MSLNQPDETCVHYWVVAPPKGVTSPAVCRECGNEAEFPNAPDNLRVGIRTLREMHAAKSFRQRGEQVEGPH